MSQSVALVDEGRVLSYLAGFFDGEGCVCACRHGSLSVQVSVAQKHPEVLEMFRARFGGQVVGHARGGYQWTCSHTIAVKFLTTMLPYLVVKGDVAGVGIALGSRPSQRGLRPEATKVEYAIREQLAARIKELNHV